MRLRHLNDFELQGLLDRRGIATENDVPGQTYLNDMESQEHLDNCATCAAEFDLYRALYGKLEEAEASPLPKNFARDVTFSLPPFKAQRTRQRLQMAGVWASTLFMATVWYLLQVDWASLWARALMTVAPYYLSAKTWVSSLIEFIPEPNVTLMALWIRLISLSDKISLAFIGDARPMTFVVLAGLALVMVASLDKLFLESLLHPRRRN